MLEKMISYRRDFHKFPESGWTEFRTSSKIADVLSQLGYEVYVGKEVVDINHVMGRPSDSEIDTYINRAKSQGANPYWLDKMEGYTGVIAVLNTNIEGPVTALRFDMDSNDVEESQAATHRPNIEGFASQNPMMMHACGHDGHVSIGLGIAEAIIQNKSNLKGTIKLVFQPAEEGVRGALAIVEKGWLDDVDYFLSGHLGFNLASGYFSARSVGFLATTKLDVTFEGVSAHAGAQPEVGKNALLAAASAALNLHAIAGHSEGTTRVNVGQLSAGSGRNVVPDIAHMKLETRGASGELNEYVLNRTYEIIDGAAKMHGCHYTSTKMGAATTAKCDEALVAIVLDTVKNVEGFSNIVNEHYLGGSEDASLMMERVQNHGGLATYMFFGTEIAAGHHNSKFDFDEGVLKRGFDLYTKLVERLNGV